MKKYKLSVRANLRATGTYTHIGPNPSTPRGAAFNPRIGAQSPRGEALPQCAEVLAAGEDLVGLDYRVAGVEERRAASLELHAIQHEPITIVSIRLVRAHGPWDSLDDKRVSVLGDEGLLAALRGPVEVACGDGSVLEGLGREEIVGEAVLLDQTLRNDPENLGPNFTDGVDAPVAGLIESLIGRRVDSLVLEVCQ